MECLAMLFHLTDSLTVFTGILKNVDIALFIYTYTLVLPIKSHSIAEDHLAKGTALAPFYR